MSTGPIADPARDPAARSLADDIRGRSDAQLTRLILARPDLARPAPADLTSLAARASTRASVQRAVEALDRGHLQVLEALVVAADVEGVPADPARLLGTSADVTPLTEDLWEQALVWRGADGLRVVRAVPDVLGPHPAGLGPPFAELVDMAASMGSRSIGFVEELLDQVVASAPAPARALLERLAWGPPVGVLGTSASRTAASWLLERHLLAAVGPDRVVLPREVALALRGGRLHLDSALEPPDIATTQVSVAVVDSVAGRQVSDLLGALEELAARWSVQPPRVLRAGGLAVRDLRRLADALDSPLERTAWVVELAHAANLVADDGEIVPVWAPTAAYDDWLPHDAGTRWAHLARAWLTSSRVAHLVGAAAPRGSTGGVNALGPDAHWPAIRAIRRDVLHELAALPRGVAPTAESVIERLAWRRPLRAGTLLKDAGYAVLREAEWLGVTGRGALSQAGRALVEGVESPALGERMSAHLPAPVDHVLLQADLTAIAPGPLTGSLAQFLRLCAVVESRGGATVHRFSAESIRRALDAGWSADELLDMLRRMSRTPLPQPLEYLVRDVARRHGRTRVGGTSAYIRSDDEAVLESMVAERGLAALQLRRIAPTVVVSPADPLVVLEALRDNGFTPIQEGPDGSLVVAGSARRRARGRGAGRPPLVGVVDRDLVATLVNELRAAEESATSLRARQNPAAPELHATDPTVALALLRDAAAERQGVWIGYADGSGLTTRHLFHPRKVEGGRAVGTVADSPDERSFSVHRITGVATP